MSTIRRLFAITAIAATASVGLIGSPASADKPITFTDTPSFNEPDPCNPSVGMTTNLTVEVSLHEGHRNNDVVTGKIIAETSNGYVGRGRFTDVGGAQFFSSTQRVMVTNPDTGQRYIVKIHANGNPNGIIVDNFDIVCLRGFVAQD